LEKKPDESPKSKDALFPHPASGIGLGDNYFLSPFFRHPKNRAPGRPYLFVGGISGGDIAGLAF
jgi:hypothetical protein